MITTELLGLLILLIVGAGVCCLLTVVAARDFLTTSEPAPGKCPPISLLRTLCGLDDRLEENLRSCFKQDYPNYEILFAVHRADDPAVAVLEKVWREFPHGPAVQLVQSGLPTVPNRKAHSLQYLV